MELRAATLAAGGAKRAHCGTGGVPLEVDHVNHNHTDNTTQNLTCSAADATLSRRESARDRLRPAPAGSCGLVGRPTGVRDP
jgi:hypothetical protein